MTIEGAIALTADSLVKTYNARRVVDSISFELRYGEVLGILGPNGAGKTTTVGMLYGAVRRDSGSISFGSLDLERETREVKRLLGVVTQEDRLDSDFSVIENLTNFAHHYRITGGKGIARAEELLDELDMDEYRGFPPEELSGGLRRRVVLARALMHRPRILFLDEPTTGLDPDARQDFWARISTFKDEGYAILLTTHYMEEAEKLCDRLLLLQQGSIIDGGSPQDIIFRHAGEDAIEAGGLDEDSLLKLIPSDAVWRPLFDGGFFISRPAGSVKDLWQGFHDLDLPSLKRRKSNLEDVFLLMTGRGLA